MSSPSNHESTSTSVKSSSCLKMTSLTTSSSISSSPQTSSIVNGHCCSIGQQSGSSGLAPIMEIREMNNYCNSCVGADKYWNHHHHGTPPLVATNVARHSVVYPQMFYTPPPPPPPPANYSGATGAPSHDWSCPPPVTADSYSHFIYSQYPPPPPPQHDYSSFLGISSSWSTESDMIMMGAGTTASSPFQLSATGNNCEPPMPPTQSMMSSFMYSAQVAPPPPVQVYAYESHINPTLSPSTSVQQRKPEKPSNPESYHRPHSSSSASSTVGDSSTDDSDDDTDDEEDSRHISIEDDDNDSIVEEEISLSADDISLCLLCKKSASVPALSQTAPSPQLSRILENIDDDELDISVCSGDIEIGGIEDEMIQQATEQHRICLQRLSQLVGIPVAELVSQGNHDRQPCCQDENEDALLCFKCQKLIGMAESLEKQLNSVLTTLKQQVQASSVEIITEGKRTPENFQVSRNSVAIQTDCDDEEYLGKFMLVSKTKYETYSIKLSSDSVSTRKQYDSAHQSKNPEFGPILGHGLFLCHECGRSFSTKRNLGKHFKRQHNESWHSTTKRERGKVLICSRENCGKTCYDQAALQTHLRKHTSEKPYFCTKCLKLFMTKSNLNAHVKSKVCQSKVLDHSPAISSAPEEPSPDSSCSSSEIPILRCENCGLTFRTEARFQTHIKTPCSKSKLFQCDICLKPFAKRSELQAHQVVHTRAKSFPCDICGLAFSTKGNQRVHQRTHLVDKRFKCQQCDKCFTRKQTLQIHMAHNHTPK